MWIVSGPRSIVPESGDGMLARRAITGMDSAERPRLLLDLQQDPERDVRRAAHLEQIGRPVEVDVVADRDRRGVAGAVAGALERLGAPGLDQLGLVTDLCFGHSHSSSPPFSYSARR